MVDTKRELSSLIASIYDPLGLVLPYTVAFKLILQEVWQQPLEWDSRLPEQCLRKISKLLIDAPLITEATVPRWFGDKIHQQYVLHILTDASDSALGAVAYVCALPDGKPVFVQALSQLVKKAKKHLQEKLPVDEKTTPDRELKAVKLGAVLYQKLASVLQFCHIVVWSDSDITVKRMRKKINHLDEIGRAHV